MVDEFGSRRIVIHPGFVKSATTSLQQLVFSRHSDIKFLGPSTEDSDVAWAIRHICHADSSSYCADEVKRSLYNAIKNVSKDKVILISHEGFALYEATDKGVVAQRLYDLFPNASVFFTIRRQDEVLPAWYLQKLPKYIRGKHYINFKNWLRIKKKEPHKSIINDLNYYDDINYYRYIFNESIGIFLYEKLKEDKLKFSRDMSNFIGVNSDEFYGLFTSGRKNKGVSKEYIFFMRIIGVFIPHVILRYVSHRVPKHIGRRLRIALSGDDVSFILSICSDGNRKLADRYGLDLKKYKYPM